MCVCVCVCECVCMCVYVYGLPKWCMVKNLSANAGDMDLIPGSGRSPVGGNGNLLQYPCLENSMGRGAWQTTVHGVVKN